MNLGCYRGIPKVIQNEGKFLILFFFFLLGHSPKELNQSLFAPKTHNQTITNNNIVLGGLTLLNSFIFN